MSPLYGITNEQTALIRAVDSLREPLKQILILSSKKEELQLWLQKQKQYINQLENNKDFFFVILVGTIFFYIPLYILLLILVNFYVIKFPDSALAQIEYASAEIQRQTTYQILQSIGIISIPISIIGGFIFLFFHKKKIRKSIEYASKFAISLESDLADVNKQLYDTALSIKDTLPVIPPDYQYSHAVEYIYSCLRNQRASTIGQAVNLYEDQLHKWKMENYASELVNIQQQQQATLNQIRGLSALNAAASVAGFFI